MRTAILTLAAVTALAAPANAYIASNGLRVFQTGPDQFTVPFQDVQHATDYLCAVGDFITVNLRLSNQTRIYRESPAPRKPGQGITFTLDKSKAVPLSIVTSFGGNQDGGIAAGSASGSYCYTYRFFPD